MKGSAEENSALVMSLWHCILAWFFADTTNIESKGFQPARMEQHMILIYSYMRSLRSLIHGVNENERHTNIGIPEMSHSFNNAIDEVELRLLPVVWVEELHSLMEELVSIHHVLKDYQLRCLTKKINNDQFTHSDRDILRESLQHVKSQPKFLVCLLTLWYWLAVWCSPKGYRIANSNHQNDHTYLFMLAIEKHSEMLARCLTNVSPSLNSAFTHELQMLFRLLMEMLLSDLQHWIDALDHFTYKMTHAGLFRGQVKKVLYAAVAQKKALHAARALEINTILPIQAEKEVVSSAPPRKVLPKKDVLKEQIHDTLIKKDFNDIVDKLEDVVKRGFDVVEDAKEIVFDDIPDFVKEVGEEVIGYAKEIGHEGKVLYHGVANLGHIVGEGIQHFAEGVGSVVHKVGNFFKHIF